MYKKYFYFVKECRKLIKISLDNLQSQVCELGLVVLGERRKRKRKKKDWEKREDEDEGEGEKEGEGQGQGERGV